MNRFKNDFTALLILLAILLPSCTNRANANPGSAEAASCDSVVDFVFLGDAMQHSRQIDAALKAGGGQRHDYTACFQYIEDDIRNADYAVCNLEVTLGGKPYKGYPCFSAPEDYPRHLKAIGFDLLYTANNHCLDTGDAGLRRTIQQLDEMNIPHIGTYVDAAERRQQCPMVTTIKGIKFAFMTYTYGTNGIKAKGNVVVNYIDKKQIAADIAEARRQGAQVLCVAMHWGIEKVFTPNAQVQGLADFLVEQGVDLIIGGHPHVVQPMEMRHSKAYDKDVLLVYSLGNIVSNMDANDCRGGSMIKVKVAMDGDKPRVYDARYKLFYSPRPDDLSENYVIYPENRRDLVVEKYLPVFDQFMKRAHEVLLKNKDVPQEK